MTNSNASACAQLREILDYPADYVGHCDRCHHEPLALWIDFENQPAPDVEFAYCAECWPSIIKANNQQASSLEFETLRVVVQEADIDQAIAAERYVDPVSLVMHRQILHRQYSVEFGAGENGERFGELIIDGLARNAWCEPMPSEASAFLRAFYAGESVAPMSFEIELPRHMVRHC